MCKRPASAVCVQLSPLPCKELFVCTGDHGMYLKCADGGVHALATLAGLHHRVRDRLMITYVPTDSSSTGVHGVVEATFSKGRMSAAAYRTLKVLTGNSSYGD